MSKIEKAVSGSFADEEAVRWRHRTAIESNVHGLNLKHTRNIKIKSSNLREKIRNVGAYPSVRVFWTFVVVPQPQSAHLDSLREAHFKNVILEIGRAHV